jgi:endogenous inhibitor of DNA gyrase (YacG/DUF329 family)
VTGRPRMARCARCGTPFPRASTGRPRAYCSNACRQADYRRRAERRAGELLREMAENGERVKGRPQKESQAVTLFELGVTPKESSRWMQLADAVHNGRNGTPTPRTFGGNRVLDIDEREGLRILIDAAVRARVAAPIPDRARLAALCREDEA